MLNAVWVAVIIAAACWAVLVAAAVYVLIKLARLITQTSAAVSGLREDSDAVIARAHATIDATAGQLNRTDEITASMDQVAAGMAELTGRVTALAPLARLAAATSGTRLARVSAFVYGVRHAAELRALRPRGRPPGSVPGGPGTLRQNARGPGHDPQAVLALLGAAVGISGYRRVTAAARVIMPAPRARELARFAGDVREGMDIYRQRQLQTSRPALEGRTDHEEDGR